MDEINYFPTHTYFGNSINENVTITDNEYVSNTEENLSNIQSENEIEIKDLLNSKYEKKNEIPKQKPRLDINTMESIRISHSFEKSKNSQSLTHIINQPFILMKKNTNDDNCYNQTIKFKKSNNIMENESSSISKKYFYYNDSNDETNSLISIKDEKNGDLNENISVLNQDFFNDNKRNQNKNDKDNNYDINNYCLKKYKIGNIFKEIFEEIIKSNKLSENDSSMKNDSLKIKNEIILKLLGYQNKENYYLSLFDSDKYSSLNTKKSSENQIKEKEKEITIEINNNKKERYFKDKSIDLNNKDKKVLIISNIDNINEYNIENQNEENIDNINNKNININREKKNHKILNGFENEDKYDKNVMISELDIRISNLLPEEENKINNSPYKKTEVQQNINNSNNNDNVKENCVVINKKNLNTEYNKNKKKSKNIIKYIYKKTLKFDKIPKKKTCSYKSIKHINKRIKSIKSIKGKKVFNFENGILKTYKSHNLFSNHDTETVNKQQNIINTSRSNCSFFALKTSIFNRIPMNNRTHNVDKIRKNYPQKLNTSINRLKNKKIKVNYLNYLLKKINALSKNTDDDINKYKDKENNINQKNDKKEKIYAKTIENEGKIINYNKLSKINISFFTKRNKAKDYTIFTKINNSHFNKILNHSHKKNSFKNKNNSKKKEFYLRCINKDMMLSKRKINIMKKPGLYSSNTKIIKRNNLNNFTLKEKIFRNQNDQNNQSEPALFKKDIITKNANNSFTQNINLYNCRKSINNIKNNCSNSLLLTDINNNKNLMNQYKSTKLKEKIKYFKPINKYNAYINNHFINFKESKSNKKRKIINDFKFNNKAYLNLQDLNEKNNILNIKKIKKNASELKCKINNILLTINNNSYNNILQKDKTPFSCLNKVKKINYKFE